MILTPVRWVTGQLAVSQENAPHTWGQITSRLRNGPAHATCLTLRLAALIRVQSNLISTSELSSPPGYIGADMGQGRERVHTWQSAQSVSSLCNVQQVSALCSLNKALQSPDCRHVTMLIHAWLLTQCYNKHRPGCKAVFAQVSLLWCDGRLIGCNESNIDSGSLHTGISSWNGWHYRWSRSGAVLSTDWAHIKCSHFLPGQVLCPKCRVLLGYWLPGLNSSRLRSVPWGAPSIISTPGP